MWAIPRISDFPINVGVARAPATAILPDPPNDNQRTSEIHLETPSFLHSTNLIVPIVWSDAHVIFLCHYIVAKNPAPQLRHSPRLGLEVLLRYSIQENMPPRDASEKRSLRANRRVRNAFVLL